MVLSGKYTEKGEKRGWEVVPFLPEFHKFGFLIIGNYLFSETR
jgi:hypothetical protein